MLFLPWLASRVARNKAFSACRKRFDFNEYALHAIATHHKNAAGFKGRLSANETQKIASRVWAAVNPYVLGTRGRPRFKGANRPLRSIEGKSNVAGIRWDRATGCVTWSGLTLPAKLPSESQDPYLFEALRAPTKYVRLVWRHLGGRRRWYAQLIQEGKAPEKYRFLAAGKVVGLDIGPSTIAIVGDEAVALERFAPSVDQPWSEVRILQRAQDRSRRATNPDKYHADGTSKKGARRWNRSARYIKRQQKMADIERCLAAGRKRDHGELANKILGLGDQIQTETLSYLAFQKCFGRSVKVRAPGAFVSLLTRKAESAGGQLEELNTRRLCMSQYDHVTDACTKKPLSQRWHRLGGANTWVQRDCYSAFLAKHATEGLHDPSRLEIGWAAAEPLLRRVGLCFEESASGLPSGSPTVLLPLEQIARQRRFVRGLSREVVAARREPGALDDVSAERQAFRDPAHACL